MSTGTLILVPNTLGHGILNAGMQPLNKVLPHHVIQTAAGLSYWVVENAKSARAFLKRISDVAPLSRPVQALSIVELPRSPKGSKTVTPVDYAPLLAPLRAGHDVGLLSEAGMPAIADPGADLVAAAHTHGISVRPLVGPSSLLLALAASGLNGQSFAFVGYLPIETAARSTRVSELEVISRRARQTQLMIETPYRNAALMASLLAALAPTTRLSISCGLTLEEGWTRSDPVSAWRTLPSSIPVDVPAVFALLAA